MRWTVLLATGASLGMALLWGPLAPLLAGCAGLLGAVVHEGVHYAAARLRGREPVTFGWDSVGPYVEYDGGLDRVVQLAPAAVGITLAVGIAIGTSWPVQWPASLAPSAFLFTLTVSPADWRQLLMR